MSQWAKTLTFPFTGTRKQPHSIILPPPTFTAGTVHSGRQCFLLFTKPRLNSVWCRDCQIEKRDEIYHCSTFPFLHSPAVACFTSLKPTLALQGDAAAMATHTMKLPVLMLKSEDFENLQLSSQQSTGDYLLCHFMAELLWFLNALTLQYYHLLYSSLWIVWKGRNFTKDLLQLCYNSQFLRNVCKDRQHEYVLDFIHQQQWDWMKHLNRMTKRCGSVYSPYSLYWSHGLIAFVAE